MSKVLIIDDDPIFGEMLSDMVTRAGHGVVGVATLREGMARVARAGDAAPFLRDTP